MQTMHRRLFLTCAISSVSLLSACASKGTMPQRPASGSGRFNPSQIVKTDIDRVAEAHQQEVFSRLRVIAEKLYRRNPREMNKSKQTSVDVAVARLFDVDHRWNFSTLRRARGTRAIQLSLNEDYTDDRVLAFVLGLASMIQSAFRDRIESFALDDLDAQGLYNAARNIEIAVWKLSSTRDARGELLLLSNEINGPVINISFEREFGKIIASLDILSKIAADKTSRAVVKVIQSLATAVFLPVR